MNQVLPLMQAARAASHPDTHLYSRPMLSELLLLHEEMIAQLGAERRAKPGNTDFLVDAIAGHVATAAMLRTELDQLAPQPAEIEIFPVAPESSQPANSDFMD